jgi:hypothetical protein
VPTAVPCEANSHQLGFLALANKVEGDGMRYRHLSQGQEEEVGDSSFVVDSTRVHQGIVRLQNGFR